MKPDKNGNYYHNLYGIGFLETMEFIHSDDVTVKYWDDIIIVYDTDPFTGGWRVMRYHGVADRC